MKYPENVKLFQVEESIDVKEYQTLFEAAWHENKELAVQNLFFAGDDHHGRGSDHLMQAGVRYLCEKQPSYINRLAQIIPEYSDWNILLVLLHYPDTKREVIHLFLGRINADINLIQERRPSSSFALCMPAGKTSNGRILAEAFHLSVDNYDSLMHTLAVKSDAVKPHTDFNKEVKELKEDQIQKILAEYRRPVELMDM